MSETTKTEIRDMLLAQGFASVGFAVPTLKQQDRKRIREFVANKEYGTMDWMEKHWQRRIKPKSLLENAQSIIMVSMNYAPKDNPLDYLQLKSAGNISVYARNLDYHDVMKKRLRKTAENMTKQYQCQLRLFVDTAPLAEKALAAAAGIGWQGKHTNLVSQQFGSWIFLGAILTDLPLPADKPHPNRCGNCQKCIDICPTNAFPEPYKLDPRKCLSYLTIEHKGDIPTQYRKLLGNRIYGCDDCLAICPWNKFAKTANETAYHARHELNNPPLEKFLNLNETQFRKLFAKSPVKRIGFERFIRNVLIASGNSGNKNLIAKINKWQKNDSPTIKEAANWAKQQILSP